MIKAYWMISNNVGDTLTPWILTKLRGQCPLHLKGLDVALSGSIINHLEPGCKTLGCGLASLKDSVNRGIDVRGVRGPITKTIMEAHGYTIPEVFGDIGMLMPRMYTPTPGVTYPIGVVPHYVDQNNAYILWGGNPRVKIINVFDPVEKVLDDICSCKLILSSSLHGLVFAHAYKIPVEWIKLSDELGGDGTKFRDHFAAVGIKCSQPIKMDLTNKKIKPTAQTPTFDDTLLWNTLQTLVGEL